VGYLSRRELLSGLAAATIPRATFAVGLGAAPAEAAHVLRAGRAELTLAPDGGLRELRFDRLPLAAANLGDGLPELRVNGELLRGAAPAASRRASSAVVFEYRVGGPLPGAVTYEVGLRALPDGSGSVVLAQKIAFVCDRDYTEPIELRLPRNLRLPAPRRRELAPTREGVARRGVIPEKDASRFAYKMAGGDAAADLPRLGIPLIAEYADSDPLRITACSEAAFSTSFRNASEMEAGEFAWTHTSGGRRGERVERTFYTIVGRAAERRAVLGLYGSALASVKPGPEWLRDVVIVHYDYLSKNGRGWFADIDALSAMIPSNARHKVVVTLHGWYDFVGRYTFDWKRKALDRKWVAFSNVTAPPFIAHATGPRSKTAKFWGWRKTFDRMRPVEMSIADVRHRIRYAKSRGFRCILYFGDGVNSGDGLTDVHDPSKVLAWGGWIGPETSGRTYSQNPLHPDVRAFYKDYLRALLAEYRDLDGLVWDETFHVRAGQRGTPEYPGYADAAMMSLVDELRQIAERHDRSLAFLSSDCLDAQRDAPYALASHGTYQDTMSNLKDWQYGLFPNLRGTLWSCNWYHQSTWDRVEKSVATYGFPVPASNGFGDDTGPSDMSAEQKGKFSTLVDALGNRRLELSWIETAEGVKTYKGRPVPEG
jgi:hypothetical protein